VARREAETRRGGPTPLIEPLTRWTCDDCGHDVSSTNGLLMFQNDPTESFLAYEFRIMHASGCQPDSDSTVTDELESYLGEDGLATLLGYLTAGPGRADEHGIAVRDMDEFVDLIRRLHTPYYEQARKRFSDPLIAETLRNDDRWHPYCPANLRMIAESAPLPGR
jgi:hypothetical protein